MLRGVFKFNLDYWSGYLLFVVEIFFAIVGRLFDTGQLLDKQPTGVGMLGFLQHPPLWFFPFLLIATFIVLSSVWYQRSRSLLSEFDEEWKGLDPQRETLHKMVAKALAQLQQEGSLGQAWEIEELIRKAGFPGDIVGICGPFRLYTERAIEQWTNGQKELLDFSLGLYPLGIERGLLSDSEHDEFHKARKKLSKFWNRWGLRCFDKGELSFKSIPLHILKSEGFYIVLLTYLEIVYARITREKSPGKQGLFQIAREVSKILSLPVRGKVK